MADLQGVQLHCGGVFVENRFQQVRVQFEMIAVLHGSHRVKVHAHHLRKPPGVKGQISCNRLAEVILLRIAAVRVPAAEAVAAPGRCRRGFRNGLADAHICVCDGRSAVGIKVYEEITARRRNRNSIDRGTGIALIVDNRHRNTVDTWRGGYTDNIMEGCLIFQAVRQARKFICIRIGTALCVDMAPIILSHGTVRQIVYDHGMPDRIRHDLHIFERGILSAQRIRAIPLYRVRS